MDVPVLEPYAGVLDNGEENLESKESCSSLARSDSGQGKSLSSVDFHDENIPPDDAKRLEPTTEIDDQLQNVTFEETPLMTRNEKAFSDHAKSVSSVCTNPDSGLEKSPISEHFTFPNSSGNHLQEFNSKDDITYRKQQKDMFEGPVSDLTNVSQGRSGKSSLQRQNSFDILHCSLDLSSFEKDKPMCELCSNNINPSPEVSISSSADCSGKCCHLVSTAQTQFAASAAHRFSCSPHNYFLHKMQAQTNVNGFNHHDNTENAYTVGIQSGCGQFFTSTLPEADIFNCHMPPQGMVPKSTLDKVIKELTMAKKKISELDKVVKELTMAKRKIRELECDNLNLIELQRLSAPHPDVQRLSAPHPDVDFWKTKYFETKEQLRIKESELQSKQDELNVRNTDLAFMETMREECQKLQFLSEGLKSQAATDADQDLQHLLQGAVRVRPVLSSSDETQVKTT